VSLATPLVKGFDGGGVGQGVVLNDITTSSNGTIELFVARSTSDATNAV
jgi:hypothetical protein